MISKSRNRFDQTDTSFMALAEIMRVIRTSRIGDTSPDNDV